MRSLMRPLREGVRCEQRWVGRCSVAGGTVIAVCVANCVISVWSMVVYYSELHHLQDYPFFATQLNACLGAVIAGVGLACTGHCDFLEICGLRELRRWTTLSFLLAAQNTLEIASFQRLGNDNLAPILQQAAVPMTLFLSATLLHTRYHHMHFVGAFLIVSGVVGGFVPPLFQSDGVEGIHGLWVAVFVLSRVPQALANVMAEGELQGRADVFGAIRVTFCTQLLGLPCNFLCALTWALLQSAFGGSGLQTLFKDYSLGLACVFGSGPGSSDSCQGALRSVAVFAIPGTLYTMSEFSVMQYSSATMYFLLAAVALPLQETALSMPMVMGSLHSEFYLSYVFAIFVVVAGLATYAMAPAVQATSVASFSCQRLVDASESVDDRARGA